MARLSRITQKLVKATVATDDLTDALFTFQNAVRIRAGDVAGRVFAFGWDEEWPLASPKRRHEMMRHYIAAERSDAAQ